MWTKSVFKISDRCLQISFAQLCTVTLEIAGSFARIPIAFSVTSWTVVPGKQHVLAALVLTFLMIKSSITKVEG